MRISSEFSISVLLRDRAEPRIQLGVLLGVHVGLLVRLGLALPRPLGCGGGGQPRRAVHAHGGRPRLRRAGTHPRVGPGTQFDIVIQHKDII